MITTIVILSAAVLLLIISLGYANTRRRQAENIHAGDQGYIKRLQEENEDIKNQNTALYESLQVERAAHQATISKLQDIQSPISQPQNHIDDNKAKHHEMAVDIVKNALGNALEKGLNPSLKRTIDTQMKRVDGKMGKETPQNE